MSQVTLLFDSIFIIYLTLLAHEQLFSNLALALVDICHLLDVRLLSLEVASTTHYKMLAISDSSSTVGTVINFAIPSQNALQVEGMPTDCHGIDLQAQTNTALLLLDILAVLQGPLACIID